MSAINERITARPTPPISKKHQPKFLTPERKAQLAEAFLKLGPSYDQLRPGYPAAILQHLLQTCQLAGIEAHGVEIADLGAGTGKLSRALAEFGFTVNAVDPSAKMLAQIPPHPKLKPIQASAEQSTLPAASQHLVTAAQAWHWFDPAAVNTEVLRILRPGGYLALLWNNLDVSIPWVHRYSRIAHAGDVLKADHNPLVEPRLMKISQHIHHWEDEREIEDFVQLALTRSHGATASKQRQAKILDNLRWYLYEHLGHPPNSTLKMPYRTDLYIYQLTETSA